MLLGATTFCADTANIWQLLGYVVLVFKIVIPLLLIIFGMVDLGKAVVSSDEKAIGKAVSSLIKRFIAAVLIFFVPTIVSAIFNALHLIDNDSDYNICVQCVTNMNGTIKDTNKTCSDYANSVTGGMSNSNSSSSSSGGGSTHWTNETK